MFRFGNGVMVLRNSFAYRIVRAISVAFSKKEMSKREKHHALIRLTRKQINTRDRIILLNYAAHLRKEISNG